MTRFAAQRLLIEDDERSITHAVAAALQALLSSAAMRGSRSSLVEAAPGGPALVATFGRPAQLVPGGVRIVGPSALQLLESPPERHAAFYFDRAAGSPNPAGNGLLSKLRQSMPQLIADAGLRSGDLISGSPIGAGRSSYGRMLAYMNAGGGPLDESLRQVARIRDDYSLEPLLVLPAEPESLSAWY